MSATLLSAALDVFGQSLSGRAFAPSSGDDLVLFEGDVAPSVALGLVPGEAVPHLALRLGGPMGESEPVALTAVMAGARV